MSEKRKILIVDDVASNIHLIAGILKEKYTIIGAKDGAKALQLAQKIPQPDLILLDIMLPDMDGYEVCMQLKKSPLTKDIPVIFVSGFTHNDEIIKSIEVGGADYISKPVSKEIILQKIETHLAINEFQLKQNKKENRSNPQEDIMDIAQIKKSILIVDDAPENLKVALEILKKDYTINVATSAKKAFEMLKTLEVDLILLDVIMPDIDGFEMCEMLQKNPLYDKIPVIFLTILEKEKDIIHGLQLGAVDYVTKPFEPEVLKARVNTHIKLKIYQDQLLKNLKDKDDILMKQSKFATLGEMFENITHQWKQPLSIINMSVANIKLDHEFHTLTDETIVTRTQEIENAVEHLVHTIDDFRDFLSQDTIKEYFTVKTVIEKTIKLLSSKLQNRNIQIKLSLENFEILHFKNDLIQVLMNILSNCIDVLEQSNQEKKTIAITLQKKETHTIIEVCDNGGGIIPTAMDKIFDKYFTTKEEQKGSGIGLYMSKKIIEGKLQGSIGAKNNQEGACFTITLPILKN